MTLQPQIPGNRSCPSTDWSIVRAAACPDNAAGKAALENLCSRYWYPIHAFIRRDGIRRRGTPEAGAQDLTQEFFAHILKSHLVERADPQMGRFRAYLFTACRNFLTNQRKRAKHDVLQGPVVSLDAVEPPAPVSASEFDLDWAFAVLTNALEVVRRPYVDRGKEALFDCLRGYLPLHDGESPGPQAEAANRLGITLENFKKKLHELRREFACQVRYQVAQTLANPEDVEQEIGELLASVRCRPATAAAHSGQPTQEAR